MEQFTRTVARMPFTAKHAARFLYAEATRAALRGDEHAQRRYITRLGQIAITNDLMLAAGAATGVFAVEYGIENHSPAFFVEAAGCALYAAGHGASGIAQHWMVRQHNQRAPELTARAVVPPPLLPDALPQPPRAPAQPTTIERVVTNAGTAMTILPVVHMAIQDLILRR
jgi:hypothetical protein